MRDYLFGLATIPAVGAAYVLVVLFAAKIIGWLTNAVHLTAYRFSPDAPLIRSRAIGAAAYAARRGLIFGMRGTYLILVTENDAERRSWAEERLTKTLTFEEIVGGRRRLKPGPMQREADQTEIPAAETLDS
jgi:hypothetical protein